MIPKVEFPSAFIVSNCLQKLNHHQNVKTWKIGGETISLLENTSIPMMKGEEMSDKGLFLKRLLEEKSIFFYQNDIIHKIIKE